MAYYYLREYGPEGSVITGEGSGPGIDLATLLGTERPPFRVSIEVGAAIADILTIAAEDRQVHGDLKLAMVRVDASGTICVEGFGTPRRNCRAPEGTPVGSETDVYGLGVTLHALLSDHPLGALSRDPDLHDNEVVQRVMAMDFGEVSDRKWVQDVQKFVTLCMAFDPRERPVALDVANVLAYVAESCPEPDLRTWAARRVVQARPAQAPAPPAAPEPVVENLGGPTRSQGPMAASLFKGPARVAPASKGESTSFWSREKIEAMLAEPDDEPEPPPQRSMASQARPAAPSWSPPPPPAEDLAPPRPAPYAAPPARPAPPPQAPPPQAPPRPPSPSQQPPPSPFAPQGGSPFAPQGTPFVVAGPVADPTTAPSSKAESRPAGKPRSKTPWIALGVVIVLLLLGCAGVGAFFAFRFFRASESVSGGPEVPKPAVVLSVPEEPAPPPTQVATPDPPPAPTPTPTPTPKTASTSTPGSDTTRATPTPKSASGTSSANTSTSASTGTSRPAPAATSTTSTSSTSTSSTSSTSRGGTSSTPTTGNPFEVKITAQGVEARLTCGDGQRRNFVGTTRVSFTSVATCRLEMGDGRTAMQFSGPASYTCTSSGPSVSCARE